ncbi:hypothetical protein V8G54_017227 [Vigna mungo]|uniref:Uncharacterized protein n=1 Tax=Vigna mungo TaxID=3915 RepID=A0AAQ3NQA0_VIGMU
MNRSTQIRNIKHKKCQISFAITFMLSPINHVRICYDKNRITHVLFSGHEERLNYGILYNKYAYGLSGTWDSSNPGFHSRLCYRSTCSIVTFFLNKKSASAVRKFVYERKSLKHLVLDNYDA